jgi:hypothetical protein
VILASFILPYTIERNRKTGELIIQDCFHNPTLLHGTLESFMRRKTFNLHWVGIITTLEDVSEQEKV